VTAGSGTICTHLHPGQQQFALPKPTAQMLALVLLFTAAINAGTATSKLLVQQ
jgi:hypothetical protein